MMSCEKYRKLSKIVKIKGVCHFYDQNLYLYGYDSCESTSMHGIHQNKYHKVMLSTNFASICLLKHENPHFVLFPLSP